MVKTMDLETTMNVNDVEKYNAIKIRKKTNGNN